jgi:conjugal transfer pilus assembly protein TraI
VWPRFRQPLAAWRQARAGAVHHLSWSAGKPGPALNAVLLHQVVPPGVLEDLGAGDGEVLAMLVASIAGLARPGPPNPLADLVRSALGLVAANVAQPMDADDPGLSRMHPMARFGVQGLRELAAQRVNWQVNAPRSRVWWGSDGVYLQWPDAVEDLTRMLVDAQVAGVPAAPAQWLHLLCACGMVVGPPHAAVVLVQPPAPAPQTQAVRIAHPHWLLDDRLHIASPLQAALASQPHMLHDAPDLHGFPAMEAGLNSGGAHPRTDPHTAQSPAPSVSVPSMPEVKDIAAHTPATPASPPALEHSRSPWRLRAPMRLAPPVREVLQAVLHDLQRGLTAGAWRLTDGLFVSANEWTTRGVPAHSAARALQACGMVPREAVGGSALTMRRTADGEQVGTLIGHAYLAMDPSPADQRSELPHADPPV